MSKLSRTSWSLALAVLLLGLVPYGRHVSGGRVGHMRPIPARYAGVIVLTDWLTPPGWFCLPCGALLQFSGSLFGLDNTGHYYAYLAQSIPSLRNGGARLVDGNLVVTYTLRPGLRWSDGVPLTMDDWKFSLRLARLEGCSCTRRIASIEVLDPRTARVTMKGTDASFAEAGWIVALAPRHYLEEKYRTTDVATIAARFGNDPYNSPRDVFAGPYKIGSWARDDATFVLVPNPFFNALPPALGHPRPAQIKYVHIGPPPSALAAAVAAGRGGFDYAQSLLFPDLAVLRRGRYHLTFQPSIGVEQLLVNTAGPLKDVRLRRALLYAIDKHALVRQLFPRLRNAAALLAHSPVSNTWPWVDRRLPVDNYDPTRARALLAQAGYATTLKGRGKHLLLRLYAPGTPAYANGDPALRRPESQILAKDWAAVGVGVSPHFVNEYGPGGQLSSYTSGGILATGHFDIALASVGISPPDPAEFAPSIPTSGKSAKAETVPEMTPPLMR